MQNLEDAARKSLFRVSFKRHRRIYACVGMHPTSSFIGLYENPYNTTMIIIIILKIVPICVYNIMLYNARTRLVYI